MCVTGVLVDFAILFPLWAILTALYFNKLYVENMSGWNLPKQFIFSNRNQSEAFVFQGLLTSYFHISHVRLFLRNRRHKMYPSTFISILLVVFVTLIFSIF